ncbi:hypothetical protein GCM10023324_39840 [Streptomyces youssoufiensis]
MTGTYARPPMRTYARAGTRPTDTRPRRHPPYRHPPYRHPMRDWAQSPSATRPKTECGSTTSRIDS